MSSSFEKLSSEDRERHRELNELIAIILKRKDRMLMRLALCVLVLAISVVATILLWPQYQKWWGWDGGTWLLAIACNLGLGFIMFVCLVGTLKCTIYVFLNLRAINGLQQRAWRILDQAYERHTTP
jgi:RsiW-degrading membrane proteinase PrsW (M82 family)